MGIISAIDVLRSSQSFKYFYTKVIGMEFSTIHDLIYNATEFKRSVTQVARGHGKTEMLSVCYPLWLAAFAKPKASGKPFHIVITSASLQQSRSIMDRIKNKIDTVEMLQFLDPKSDVSDMVDGKGFESASKRKRDNSLQLLTSNNVLIEAAPFGPGLRGRHPDMIIMDDILKDEENLASTVNEEKAWRTVSKVVIPMTETNDCKVIVVGTPMSLTDPLQRLSEDSSYFNQKIPACSLDDEGALTTPVWKERFTIEKLERIRETQGELAFQQEYMLNPIG